jgi:hypothetical protein
MTTSAVMTPDVHDARRWDGATDLLLDAVRRFAMRVYRSFLPLSTTPSAGVTAGLEKSKHHPWKGAGPLSPRGRKGGSAMTKITHAMLFSALLPQFEMEERQALDWGEKFLDGRAQRQLRDQFEYQGSNIPVGVADFELARHKRRSTRQERDDLWLARTASMRQ